MTSRSESRGHSYAATRQPLPSRYAPSADSYTIPVNFEEPLYHSQYSALPLAIEWPGPGLG
jgi:hypothetical protein